MTSGRLTASDLEGAAWRTSSYSGGQGECVEVADGIADAVPVRDSKRPAGPTATFTHKSWRAFIESLSH